MATFEGRFTDASGLRIAILVARFNDLVTAKLLSGCLDCLARHGVDTSATSAQLDVAWVPGINSDSKLAHLPRTAGRCTASRPLTLATLFSASRGGS